MSVLTRSTSTLLSWLLRGIAGVIVMDAGSIGPLPRELTELILLLALVVRARPLPLDANERRGLLERSE
jgi:hypothetical protein